MGREAATPHDEAPHVRWDVATNITIIYIADRSPALTPIVSDSKVCNTGSRRDEACSCPSILAVQELESAQVVMN